MILLQHVFRKAENRREKVIFFYCFYSYLLSFCHTNVSVKEIQTGRKVGRTETECNPSVTHNEIHEGASTNVLQLLIKTASLRATKAFGFLTITW